MTQELNTPTLSPTPVRLVDIARRANVSRTTVAKVILQSAGENARVSTKTAMRVRQVADEMGYRPNLTAQRLAGKQSKIIGITIDTYAPTPSYQQLAEMERFASEAGYRVMVGQMHDDLSKLNDYMLDFKSSGVDGVICISHDYPGIHRQVVRLMQGFENVVFVGKTAIDRSKVCWAAPDHETAQCNIVSHLVEQGKKRIVLGIGNTKHRSHIERRKGYRDGLEASNLPYDPDLVFNISDTCEGLALPDHQSPLTVLLKEKWEHLKFDAIITSNDVIALYVIRAIETMGLCVPDDVAVTGYDNLPMAHLTKPAITTVDLCNHDLAQASIDLLIRQIQGKTIRGKAKHRNIIPKLIIRQST
ncbi:MAG: hypothetical protein CMJ19_04895 [Phycisphaeraceae bacterium]|nr:hypothetical protein [Phycisphaeraceae bacterium]